MIRRSVRIKSSTLGLPCSNLPATDIGSHAPPAPSNSSQVQQVTPVDIKKASKKRRRSVPKEEIVESTSVTSTYSRLRKLLDLGTIFTALVIRRPSLTIKSPYVSDIINFQTLVHPPSYLPDRSQTLYAFSQTQSKRSSTDPLHIAFAAKPLTGKEMKVKFQALMVEMESFRELNEVLSAHSPSLDCAGMVVPGATVYCTLNNKAGSTAKSNATIQLCEECREDGSMVRVGYHPALAESVCRVMLEEKLLESEVGHYDRFQSQFTIGNSRFDYVLHDESTPDQKSVTILEVKNVPGCDYPSGLVPAVRSGVGVYEYLPPSGSTGYVRSAIFPHGATKAGIGVVSDRAIKHIWELTQIQTGKIRPDVGTKVQKIQCAVIFIVNRSDCAQFRPCHEADMLFAQVLKRAAESGVKLICKSLVWSLDDSSCYLHETLPVVFDEAVQTANIDEEHLKKVLEYNEAGN